MASTDVAGRRRIGMFEKVSDDMGNTFEQTSGRGNIAQFKTQTGAPFVANTASCPDTLRWKAQSAGALPEPDMGLSFYQSPRRTTL